MYLLLTNDWEDIMYQLIMCQRGIIYNTRKGNINYSDTLNLENLILIIGIVYAYSYLL